VVSHLNNATAASDVVSKIKATGQHAIAINADVSKIVNLFEHPMAHFGQIDIVTSNSCVMHFDNLLDVTPEEFDRTLSINTRGQLFVAQQAYKNVTQGGRLIPTSSISAHKRGVLLTMPSILEARPR
jgi:tetrahydroxynaphthalene reductase